MTARDLLEGSLRLLGVLASGESASASEAADGLSALNQLLDSWSTESLVVPNRVRDVLALVASQQTYTMGTGGNWNTARPLKIEQALIQISGTSPVEEIPISILNQDEYAAIELKTLTATFPSAIYSDNAYPLTNVSVYPVATDATNHIVLYSQKALTQLSSLSTSLSLPPGYDLALKFNLAVDLAPEYGRGIPEIVAARAIATKAALERLNTRPLYLKVDAALTSRSSVFDWRTGDFK